MKQSMLFLTSWNTPMRYLAFIENGKPVFGVNVDGVVHVVEDTTIEALLASGVDLSTFDYESRSKRTVEFARIEQFLPLLSRPGKILCIGLNYADHTKESPYEQPSYPTISPRFNSSLVAHGEAMIRPKVSDSEGLDFEGEMVVVLNGGGRHVAKEKALDCIAGYSIFNEGSVREYQFKSPQWTVGKNFDKTGAFGPELVTADEVPEGGKGLTLETRLNGEVVQSASTDDMIFDVATLISVISEAITLEAGDVIVTGTPAGIGWARTPRLLMNQGDVCEVSISKLGTLKNSIEDER